MTHDGGRESEEGHPEERKRVSFEDLERALGGEEPPPLEESLDELADGDASSEESYFGDLLSTVEDQDDETWDELDEGFEWGGSGGGIISDSKSQAILELLRGAKNVLLVGPLLCPADYEIGTTLIGGGETEPFNLLLVTFSQSPDDRLQICRSYLDSVPEETRIIGVGSLRGGADGDIETPDGAVSVSMVSNPADLKRIGIKINQTLNDWDETDRRAVVCFHSLSALLQYVDDPRRIFRFLSILRGRIQKSEGHAHYHIDSNAKNDTAIETIRSLFDAVITYDEDGDVSINT